MIRSWAQPSDSRRLILVVCLHEEDARDRMGQNDEKFAIQLPIPAPVALN
jgi:hypothetical protein